MKKGFTLVEMLMALLIVSIVLSASLPVITSRQKQYIDNYNRNNTVPIGMIAIWGSSKALPENTWLECNGQAIPNGIEYEEIRKIYGTNLPDYRGVFLRGFGGNSAAIGVLQEGTGIGSQVTYAHQAHSVNNDGVVSSTGSWIYEADNNANRHTMYYYRVRPINKAVRYIIKVRS